MSPITKIIHAWSSTTAALSLLTVCPLHRSCSHFPKRPKNTISWAYINPNLTLIISPHSHKNSTSIITHPLNCTCQSKRFDSCCSWMSIFLTFLYVNMHILNDLTSGAVHIHPWCHTGGLSMWRNSDTSVRVQSYFLWADSHRLSDQLITHEGWIPGKCFTDHSLAWRTDWIG